MSKPDSITTPLVPVANGDRELVRRMGEGESEALDAAIGEHWSTMVAYASGLLGGSDPAEDVVQEAFIGLWERREEWASTTRLRPLLFRMVRNLALNEQRRRRVRVRWAERSLRREVRSAPTPGEEMEASELRDRVEAAIRALSPRRREVFLLVRFHDLSLREVAEIMGTSQQTVANQMSSALADLRSALHPILQESGTGPRRPPARTAGAPPASPPPAAARTRTRTAPIPA